MRPKPNNHLLHLAGSLFLRLVSVGLVFFPCPRSYLASFSVSQRLFD
uniref:Uncharacterized protein n=1 Tax=Rhizophora mucronata TaxID=61149 RepID=A0A2P2J9E4_RHIMU